VLRSFVPNLPESRQIDFVAQLNLAATGLLTSIMDSDRIDTTGCATGCIDSAITVQALQFDLWDGDDGQKQADHQ
jgi:hypothetical protein